MLAGIDLNMLDFDCLEWRKSDSVEFEYVVIVSK